MRLFIGPIGFLKMILGLVGINVRQLGNKLCYKRFCTPETELHPKKCLLIERNILTESRVSSWVSSVCLLFESWREYPEFDKSVPIRRKKFSE